MARISCPCRGCFDRAIGCHGKCKDYMEWQKQVKEKAKWERDSQPPKISGGNFTGTGRTKNEKLAQKQHKEARRTR